jgi:phosphoglycerate dehydrogenase-like enzyme
MSEGTNASLRVMIANPLEPALVERIRTCPAVDEVLYDPALLPAPRYPADHNGDPSFALNAQAQARFDDMLAESTVLYGYPGETAAGLFRSLELGPLIRYVQGTSAGMGAHIRRANLPEATLQRVIFCSAAGVHARMLAEFAFYGLLALRKDETRLRRIREERAWEHYTMNELDGQTIGIVGMGQIGAALAQIARAFNMRIIAVQRKPGPNVLADVTRRTDEIVDVAREVDVLAMALPMTELTAKMASAEVIAALRPDAVFINVGRGTTVDQRALTESLQNGRIAGAVLDVFDSEPLPPENPLWTAANVVMSPHTAGLSIRENERIVTLLCENLRRLKAGEPLRNRVNLTEFY